MDKTKNLIPTMLTSTDPPAFKIIRQNGKSPYIIVCDHAVNKIPEKLNNLNLDNKSLNKHIAIDIGALGVASIISEILDAPLIYSGYSRLVIDVNRPLDADSSIPEVSDGILIPGNIDLEKSVRKTRAAEIFYPYHSAITSIISDRLKQKQEPILIAVHSFTPVLGDKKRPWEIGITYGNSATFAKRVLNYLMAKTEYNIGNNKPYAVDNNSDYTIPVHGDKRNIQNVLFEIRQDLLSTKQEISKWGKLLAAALLELGNEDEEEINNVKDLRSGEGS